MSGSAFAIDFRSLRIFRFGLGAVLLLDLAFRLKDFTSLHTEAGVLPAGPLNSPAWAAALFAAMAGCGILLLLNVRPRTVSLLAFVLALSLRNRNPWMTYGGDDLLRLALLWSAFLPAAPLFEGEKGFFSPAALAVFVQIFALYFCAGMSKTPDAWWEDGRAAFLALNGGTYARPQAAFLLGFPGFLTYASAAVFLLERFGWLLFFSPWRHSELRVLGCAVFAAMHISFGFFMRLELFPLIDIVLLTLLLPSEFWDRLGVRQDLPPAAGFKADRYLAPAPLALAVLVAAINISYLPQFERRLWRPARHLTAYAGLDQAWSMFTPIDKIGDGYHRLIATAPDGRKLDLLNGRELSALPPRPVDVQSEQRGFRWTRYLDAIAFGDHDRFRRRLLEYFCAGRTGWTADWYYFSEQNIAAAGVRPLQDSALILSRVCD